MNSPSAQASNDGDADRLPDHEMHMTRELEATKAHLRETIEESETSTAELEARNKELRAINEKLRSATEALETGREELQSTNEELRTVNDELKSKLDLLARTNNDLQSLMAATDIATVFLDRELRIQRFTPSAKAVFSFIATDLGRPLADLSRQLDYPEIVADAERSLALLQPAQREIRAGGRWYIARTVPYRTADDYIAGVVITFLDITAQKESETALRASEARFRTAVEAVSSLIWTNNARGEMEGEQPGWGNFTGQDRNSYQGYGWTRSVHPDDAQPTLDAWKEAVAEKKTFVFKHRVRRNDGQWRLCSVRAVPVLDDRSEISEWVGVHTDITDQKTNEEQLQASEAKHRFAVTLADTLRPLSDPVEVQAEASRVLGEHLGANRVLYFEIRDDEYVIEREHTKGVQPIAGRYPVASFGPALLAAFMDGRTVVERDATTQPDRPSTERAAFAAIQVRGHVDVPLVKGGEFVGGMTVQHSEPHDWTPQEVALIGDTAERTWAAVERVRAEAALRQSEERSAFVRRSSGVGLWYCDLPFDVLQWDELVKAHFHLPPDALVTIQTFYDRIHPDDREPTRRAIEQSIASRTQYNVDYRTVDPDTGALKWVRAMGRTAYAADGSPIQFDGVTLDVSDQKRAEASLRESEQRFRLVADAAPVLIWLSGIDKMCYWFNQPWLAFTGRSMDQETGNGWVEGVHTDDVDRCLQTYTAAFDARTPFSMEYRLRRHDGEFRWLIDNGAPRYDSGGAFDGFIGSCLDVTDYKNAEAALRVADRRKDEFLATLAHELRNPLAPIRNGLQVIRMSGANGTIEPVRSMMERQLTQLVSLVDDLLDASRVTSGKLELRLATVDVRAVIDAAVETSRPVIEEAGHELTITMPDESIWVNGDMTRLAQVVSNLLTNSAKYTHRGGHIRLSVARDQDMAAVSVVDDGIGIPAAMLSQVFDMFTQVDRALEKTAGGLGIGLSLVKGLVEMHRGTVEARSEGEGRGSEFVMRLPLVLAAVQNIARQEPAEQVGPSSRRRILVADDNVDAAESLGKLLELLGQEVITTYDGLHAVEAAESFRPDLMLLDIGMPKLNGYEAARRVRAHQWGQDIVLVALTGWGQQEDRNRSSDAGFDHHLVKPVEISVLTKLLAGLQAKTV